MNFELSIPTRIVFGAGRFATIHRHVRGLGKRAFIVTSPSFLAGGARAAVLDALIAQLKKIGVETQVFGAVEPNPRTTTINRAAQEARNFHPRYVLALGGGSAMDAAKCIALLAVNDGEIWDYAYKGPGHQMRSFNHALPIVCVPTIAATSSETSLYAVVTNEAEHRKTSIFGQALIPTLSIIDPELTYSVPAHQTIYGAFDMITHVMESYLSSTTPTPLQDRLTEALVETVITQLPRVLANPKDALGRSSLSWCGALALSGIMSGRSGAWPIHALEHGLSALTDVAHGRGLALLLPRIMKFDETVIGDKIKDFNRRIFGADSLDAGLVKFMKDVGAWTTLAEIAPNGADLDALIDGTVEHALSVSGIWKQGQEPYLDNIRPLTRADARAVLFSCKH